MCWLIPRSNGEAKVSQVGQSSISQSAPCQAASVRSEEQVHQEQSGVNRVCQRPDGEEERTFHPRGKYLLRGKAGQVGQSPRVHRVRRPLGGVHIHLEQSGVDRVGRRPDGEAVYPIKGEKPSCEAKTPRVHCIGRPLEGVENGKWKDKDSY
jgi:hypothetical protein